jgi:phosphohistidine phosphatase
MAKYLGEHGITADLIVSSPANRAITTARIIQKFQQSSNCDIIEEVALYHASVATILSVIHRQSDEVDCLMVFGHNPSFTDCANQLTNLDIANIPTCGVVGIRFDVDKWSGLKNGIGVPIYSFHPKRL